MKKKIVGYQVEVKQKIVRKDNRFKNKVFLKYESPEQIAQEISEILQDLDKEEIAQLDFRWKKFYLIKEE